MSENFPNAPLVELMAEVRWDVRPYVYEESVDVVEDTDAESDWLFRSFGKLLARDGYARSERLTPPGYPAPPGMAVYRFSGLTNDDDPVIFQIGPGVMSVNAIPPYKTWDNFRPKVELGLDNLLVALEERSVPDRFSRVVLRYIDAFGEDFLGDGGTRREFLTDILGFDLRIPGPLLTQLDDTGRNTFVQFSSNLKNGGRVSVRAGDATVENQDAVVLDTTIAFNDGCPAEPDRVMAILDSAHEVIHDTFVQMTQPVAHILNGAPK